MWRAAAYTARIHGPNNEMLHSTNEIIHWYNQASVAEGGSTLRRLLALLFIAVLALAVFIQPTTGVQAHADQGVSAIVHVDSPVVAVSPDVGATLVPFAMNDSIVIPIPKSYAYVDQVPSASRADYTTSLTALTAIALTSATEDDTAFHLLV